MTPIQLASFLDTSSVLVLPYREATQSGVAAYGIGRGVPIIATTVGGLPEMVQHNITGILIPPADIDSLVGALKFLYSSPQICDSMSDATLLYGNGLVSWDKAAFNSLKLYNKILSPS